MVRFKGRVLKGTVGSLYQNHLTVFLLFFLELFLFDLRFPPVFKMGLEPQFPPLNPLTAVSYFDASNVPVDNLLGKTKFDA
jgi:hypothetical protein